MPRQTARPPSYSRLVRRAEMLTSFGGPRVLLLADSGQHWTGASDQWSDPNGERNDHYAQACESGFLATIAPYGVPIVVLGGEPGDLRCEATPEGHVFWVWIFGESQEQARQLALQAFNEASWDESLRIELGGRYRAIDAAMPWSDAQECLETDFEPGDWQVSFTYIERDDEAAEVYAFRHAPLKR